MTRKVFAVDIHEPMIAQYRAWHTVGAVPPAVTAAIRADDIRELEIYLVGDRLMMIMDQGEGFDPDVKADRDAGNVDVHAWDALMRTFQKPLPFAPDTTWAEMERIYSLVDQG